MLEKVIQYGTIHKVKVASASESAIILIGEDVKEGFVLLGHGVVDLPDPGDKGTIKFERDNNRGHWEWYPETT